MDTLQGTFGATVWRSDDGADLIARFFWVRNDDIGGKGSTVTVLGPAPTGRTTGVTFRLHGEWTTHAQHGRQFRYAHAEVLRNNRAGVIAYLHNVCDGVGEKRAAALYEAFGGEAVDVLRHDPARVVEAGILTEALARGASQQLHDEGAHQDTKIALATLLDKRGFQQARAARRCIQLWGRRAPEFVRNRPYLLLLRKVPSCGWKRVDKLYCDLGHRRDALKRQALTVLHYLLSNRNGRGNGDTWTPARMAADYLTACIPTAEPLRAMRLAERARLVVVRREAGGGKGRWLAPREWAEAEATIAHKLRELMAWTPSDKSTRTERASSGPWPAPSAAAGGTACP